MKCRRCKEPAVVALPSHHTGFCAECFDVFLLRQAERSIKKHNLLRPGDSILVALSGGKDSLALMHILHRLGYEATGLHLDLGIEHSSESARASVEDFCGRHGYPLIVHEFASQGIPIPLVRKIVKRPICAVCGKLKRHAFNRIAVERGFTVLATGHNLDDEVGRLFANVLRWDSTYLAEQGPVLEASDGFVRKIKPLYRTSEFELANYCFLQGIEYHMAGCPFSKGASFSFHKELWEDLETHSPGQKLNFMETFLKTGRPVYQAAEREKGVELHPCEVCGSPTTAETCSVCRIREQVHKGAE